MRRRTIILLVIIGVIILWISLVWKSFIDKENAELRSVIRVEVISNARIS